MNKTYRRLRESVGRKEAHEQDYGSPSQPSGLFIVTRPSVDGCGSPAGPQSFRNSTCVAALTGLPKGPHLKKLH